MSGRCSSQKSQSTIDSPKKTTGRWKNRNISSSKKMKRKMRRNQGAPYASDTTGRNIPGRKCQSLTKELHISNNFWNLWDSIFTMHISFFVLRQQGIKGYT
jgi:hypothetical protein